MLGDGSRCLRGETSRLPEDEIPSNHKEDWSKKQEATSSKDANRFGGRRK